MMMADDKVEKTGPAPPKKVGDDGIDPKAKILPGDGARRSRRLRNLPPSCEGGGDGDACSGTDKERVLPFQDGTSVQGEGILEPEVAPGQEQEGGDVGTLSQAGGAGTSSSVATDSGAEVEAHRCLFNEDVLEHIFKFIVDLPRPRPLPAHGTDMGRDVQILRQVCKSWKDSATRLYRRTRSEFRLGLVAPDHGNEMAMARFTMARFTGFVDTMRGSSMIPVQSYFLTGDIFFRYGSLKIFQSFLRICGPGMVHLKFCLDDSRHVEQFILKGLPNLKLMKLKTLRFLLFDSAATRMIQPGQVHGIAKLVGRLLTATETLAEFDFTFGLSPNHPPLDRHTVVMEQVGEAVSKHLPKTVRNIRLWMDVATFIKLSGKGLKWETFDWSYITLDGGALRNFLEGQASTLQGLRVAHMLKIQKAISLELPPLNELVKLNIEDMLVAPLGGSFPKLKCLNISNMGSKPFAELLSGTKKTLSCTVTELHLPKKIPIASMIKNVADSFPAINELHVVVNPGDRGEVLRQIFSHLDAVEILSISFNARINADIVLNGVSYLSYPRLRVRRQDWEHIVMVRPEPSILNLTKLRKLKLSNADSVVTLTDLTAHFAFLVMADLQELHLVGLGSEICPGYIRRLEDKLILKLEP